MGNLVTALVTGAGAPGAAGTIGALRNNPDGLRFRIVATDINDEVVGKYLADRFQVVPGPESGDYIHEMLSVCEREHVDVIVPQTTREIGVLSKHVREFLDIDVGIVVCSPDSINIANDKYLLMETAKEANVPCPESYLTCSNDTLMEAAQKLGYPRKNVVVKPRISNGMRGFRVVTEDSLDVSTFLREKPDGVRICLSALMEILERGKWPELIVSEYLPGPEYTVDVFRGAAATIAIPRLREKIRSGITFDARVELRNDLVENSIVLAEILNLKYCFGFQYKCSDDGIPKLMESNPRVQGTMVTSNFAGFNMIYYSVLEALGSAVAAEGVEVTEGLRFSRYWGGLAALNGDVVGRV